MFARVNLTPLNPVQQACKCDPTAVAHRQKETCPEIMCKARRDKATIFIWDESGFRADTLQRKTWRAEGHTPVVRVAGQRQGIYAVSVVDSKGGFSFAAYKGDLNVDRFVEILRRMMNGRCRPVDLVVVELFAHMTKFVRKYVDSLKGKMTPHFLLGFAPDLNLDELVWSDAKRTRVARHPLRSGEKVAE